MLGRDQTIKFEIELRGATIKASVTIEGILMKIVFFSNAQQYYTAEEPEHLKLKTASFGTKVNRARTILKEYHKDLERKYHKAFISLDSFVAFRNRMSHREITWEDRTIEVFTVWDVKEGQSKYEELNPIKYSKKEALDIVAKSLTDIVPPLKMLLGEVELRLKSSQPSLYTLLRPAHNNH